MSQESPFESPLLQVWLKDPVKGAMLANARVQQLGNRTFIVGQFSPKEGVEDTRDGLTAWMPVEDVVMLTEYPDRARVDQANAEWEKRRKKKARKGWWHDRLN
jgi:hypothetical protein